MASNRDDSLFQCTGCHEELNLESKTLPCLHSFCRSCLGGSNFDGESDGNNQCPECHEHAQFDQLTFSPFLVRSLRRRQLESSDWKCDMCAEDGVESSARNWCHGCKKLFCTNCSRFHNRLQKSFHQEHNMSDLGEMERGEVIEAVMMDMCYLHQKTKDSYCEQCNLCVCDTCYKNHSDESPGCSSQPLPVREEALKQKLQGPALLEEMDELKMNLRRLNERTRSHTDELNSDCDAKCRKLWEDFEEMMENAKLKTDKLCEEMRQRTAEQVKRWRCLLDENEKILKQLEIWRLNLHHLLSEFPQDVDVVCGLRLLRSKLSSQLQKSIGPAEKCQLRITFPNWWLQVLEQFKNEEIGTVSLTTEELRAQNLRLNKQWHLPGSNLAITSIHVSKDNHVFVCDVNTNSIIEFTKRGSFVSECNLFEGENTFTPTDMCLISPDIFIVACGHENKLIILERNKIPPFLQIKQIIHTKSQLYSVCKMNSSIFSSDIYLQVDSITKEGEKIKIIKSGRESFCNYANRIRFDPSSGNFLQTELFSSEIIYHKSNGEKLCSVKIEEISDFCVDEFGHLYFCNCEGIFYFPLKKMMYKFEKRSEFDPKMFISKGKIYVCLRLDKTYLIKILKIIY